MTAAMARPGPHFQPLLGQVAILLSTHNGAAYLPEQLDSLSRQSHQDWVLYWRDDRSSDATRLIMKDFLVLLGPGRSVVIDDGEWIGSTASFLRLLGAAHAGGAAWVAFADQDDIWLPNKLARGLRALATAPQRSPALYCARQVLVDAALRRMGESPKVRHPGGFPAALAQNIATGCTLMLNAAAAGLVASSRPPAGTVHDWWCYLLVAAAGGQVLADPEPVVLYRQHESNLIGAPASASRRAAVALRRGPGAFMAKLRAHVAALADQPHLMAAPARRELAVIAHSLARGPVARLKALRLPGLRRQTITETLLFRLWFLAG
jgi:glycosyltransferase involved in cell wall biosynthesis